MTTTWDDGKMYRIEGSGPTCYLESYYDPEREGGIIGHGELIENSCDGGSYICYEAYIERDTNTLKAGNPVWLSPELFNERVWKLIGLPYHEPERAGGPDPTYEALFPIWNRTRYVEINGLRYDNETGFMHDVETGERFGAA